MIIDGMKGTKANRQQHSDQPLKPFLHLQGRGLCKRDHHDLIRLDPAFLHQITDPFRQDGCLPASRSRKYQRRSVPVRNRRPLGGVKSFLTLLVSVMILHFQGIRFLF